MTALDKADAKKFFAEFGVRMAAIALDLMAAIFIAYQLLDVIAAKLYVSGTDWDLAIAVVLLVYFAGSWVSPMRATPVQFLFGMRVVDVTGEKLTFGRAALRGLLLALLVVGSMTAFAVPGNPIYAVIALLVVPLVFLAALTPNRQAVHDLIVRSIVVNKIALKSPENLSQLREHVADKNPATRKNRRPSILSIIVNVLVLAVPLVILTITAQVSNDRDLRARTIYAIGATGGLRAAVQEYYMDADRWPTNELEAGAATRGDYPDGGYYELEDNGVIRIYFTKIPKLMKMTIVLTPRVDEEGVTWRCRADGDISPGLLMAPCRDGTEM